MAGTLLDYKNEKLIQHSTSDSVSICTTCGKPFQQIWSPSREIYSNFKTCGACRLANRHGGINMNIDYEPHWGQELVHASAARYKIICAGARWGKDRCSIMEGIDYFIKCLNEDRGPDIVPHALWWIIAPTDRIANQNWREIIKYFPAELVMDVSKTTRSIQTINGGVIEVHSAYEPESLVAVGLDLVTITEAARIADLENVWANLEARLNSPGKGLGGKGGRAIINSSPLGRDYFYKMWNWGMADSSDYDPDFESWRFSTWDNPHMAVRGNEVRKNGLTYKENLRKRMSDKRYRQDYMAEFISEVNMAFPNANDCFVKLDNLNVKDRNAWKNPEPYETYVIGYDPATGVGEDEPMVWIRNSKGRVVLTVSLRGFGWDPQWDRIAFYSKHFNGALCKFGRTGLGEVIESQLTKRGVPNEPIDERGGNKERLVENLAVIIEQKMCEIPWSQEIENQFNDYVGVKNKSGGVSYGNATRSGHDDHVSAAYFCFDGFIAEKQTMPYMGRMSRIARNVS